MTQPNPRARLVRPARFALSALAAEPRTMVFYESPSRLASALVDMGDAANKYSTDYGDGMRKKVAIARALTLDPEFVIFDEPTTGIDPLSAAIVDNLIRDLSDRLGVTSIVISHDLRSIFRVADRVAMLYQGQFRLDGAPEIYRQTDDPIVHQFINGLPEGPFQL